MAAIAAIASAARSGELAAEIEARESAVTATSSERVEIPILVRNAGTTSWDPEATHPVRATYHLLSAAGSMLRFENPRTRLPARVEPGETLRLDLSIDAPREPGDYLLEIDLVQEGVAWFEDRGSQTLRLPLKVSDLFASWRPPPIRLEKHGSGFGWRIPDRPALERLQLLIKKTIATNRTELRFGSSRVYGFSAGTTYPQIWIRDNATIVPTSRYLLDERYLTSWILAHLAIQAEDGSVYDYLRGDGSFEKNTAEADQESSLVGASWIASQVLGPDWLRGSVRGKSVIDRIEACMRYLLERRRDPSSGLIRNAHTADWGDVSPEFPDQRAVDLYPSSKLVVGVYTQAMAYRAMSQIAELLEELGATERAAGWRREARRIAEQSHRVLWSGQRGFFRVHRHLDFPPHPGFSEPDIFALGGNAMAILSGLASPEQSARIVAEATRRRERFGISTISGVLLPPYPEGFFSHPALDGSFEYQNGGQWDWFGGRLILGMYRLGDLRATEELSRVASKAVSNRGLFEWDTREGRGRGSAHYAGSAGVLGRAVIEGLFGVEWSAEGVTVTPRLGPEEGYLYLPQPSTGEFLAYHYRPDRLERSVSIRIETDLEPGVRLRLPTPFEGVEVKAVRVGGRPVGFEVFGEGGRAGIALDPLLHRDRVEVLYARRSAPGDRTEALDPR